MIVCERTGRWAQALRRESEAADLAIRQTRSLAECWEELGRFPRSFVVVELAEKDADALLARTARWEREFPLARWAIVADRSLAAYEWLLREAGAAWFGTSPRELGPLAGIARRHLEQVPPPELGVVEEIRARLPWGKDEG